MNKLDYCYHTHTKRCGHAIGEDEQFVIEAIKCGIKRLGFSDHIFLEGFEERGIRGDFEELPGYLKSIRDLKEKYKDKIDIKVGFEAEYLPQYLDYYRKILKNGTVDYLILGQHNYIENNKSASYFNNPLKYFEDVIEGIKSGLFKYLCHPDLFMLFIYGWDKQIEAYARKILEACEQYDMPIEINLTGIRRNRAYPCDEFFKLSKEYKLRYVIGVDAHAPEHFNKEDIAKAFEFAKKHNIEIIDLVI